MSSRAVSSPASRERLGLLLGFIGMVIFGGTLPATRIAVAEIDPIALTALRTAIAGVCSLALLLVLRRPLPPRALWRQLVIAMLCVAVLFPLLMSMGMQRVDASHGGVVLDVLPIATALVARTAAVAQRLGCTELNAGGGGVDTPMLRVVRTLGFEVEPAWVTFSKQY